MIDPLAVHENLDYRTTKKGGEEDNPINELWGNLSRRLFSFSPFTFFICCAPMVPRGRMKRLFLQMWIKRGKIVKAIKALRDREFPSSSPAFRRCNLCSEKEKRFSAWFMKPKCLRNRESRNLSINCLRCHSSHRALIFSKSSTGPELCFHFHPTRETMSKALTGKCIHHLEMPLNVAWRMKARHGTRPLTR